MRKESKLETLLSNEENIDLILSYSRVSDFDRNGPIALIEKTDKDSQALKMGSVIDDLLFSADEFGDKYHVSDYNEPTATLGVLCNIIVKNYTEVPDIEEVFNIIERNSLWKATTKRELLQKNFDHDEFWGYLKDKFECGTKIVVTSEEKSKADDVVDILLNHPFSKHIFTTELEHHYQYKFLVDIGKFKFRGILDIVSIDHKNKIVYFKDLKTGGAPSSEFTSSYIKWRYYLQEAVYSQAFDVICKELGLEGYTQAPFEFVYIGLKEKIPVTFKISQTWHDLALTGFKTNAGYKYKGLYELIDEIYFHWKNKVYDLPKNIYDNQGTIYLDDSFINP